MSFGRAARLSTSWKEPLVERGELDARLGRFREAVEDLDLALQQIDSFRCFCFEPSRVRALQPKSAKGIDRRL